MNPLTSSASGARSADPTCATKRISGFEVGEQTASSASERHLLLADYIPVASPSRAPNTSYSSSELYSSYPTGMLSSPMRFNSDSLVPTLEHALHSPALSKSNSAPMPPPALLSRSQVRRDGSASSFDGGLDILGQSVDDPYEEPPTARRGQGHHYSHSVPNFSAGFPSYTSSGGISNYLMPPHSAASTSSAYSASSSAHQESFADMTFSLPPSLVSSSGKSQPAAIRNRGMRRSSSSQSSASTQIPTSRLAQASPILGQGAGSSQRRPSAPAEMHFTFPGVQHAMPHMQHQQSTESDFLSMCGSMTSDTASAFGSPPQPAPRQFSATAMSKNMQPINTGQFMPSSAPASAVSFGGDSLAGDDDAHLTANEKKRKRRVAHNMVERKRRDGINTAIQQLSDLLPSMLLEPSGTGQATHHHHKSLSFSAIEAQNDILANPNTPIGSMTGMSINTTLKPNKSLVLSRTVDYVQHLQQLLEAQTARNRQLEQSVRELGGTVPSDTEMPIYSSAAASVPNYTVMGVPGYTPPQDADDDLFGIRYTDDMDE